MEKRGRKLTLRKSLIHVKDPFSTQRRRNMLHNIRSVPVPTWAKQSGSIPHAWKNIKTPLGDRTRNSIATGHAVDWTRASVDGNGSTSRSMEFREAMSKQQRVPTRTRPCFKAVSFIVNIRLALSPVVVLAVRSASPLVQVCRVNELGEGVGYMDNSRNKNRQRIYGRISRPALWFL